MKLRFSKINWILRPSQFDVKPKVISTHQQQQQINRRFYSEDGATTAAVADGAAQPPLFDLHGRRHNYLRISLTERCNLRWRAADGARGAGVARGAGAAGARAGGAGRGQGAADGRRAHAARRPGRRGARAGGRAGPAPPRAHHQRARAHAPPARAAARRPHAPQRVAGLAARRPVRGCGAPARPAARAGRRGPGAAARIPPQAQRRAHQGVQRRRDRRLRGLHARPRPGRAVHRVHAVRRQPVGGGAAGAARGGAGGGARAARAGARAGGAARHGAGVARGGAPRPRGVHLVADAALLRRVQPAAADGGRQPQGVPVRHCRGVLARRHARGRRRRGAAPPRARRAAPQAAAARGHAAAGAAGQPAHDPHRRLAARGLCSLPHLDAQGAARMVDVGDKAVTRRAAEAECWVQASERVLRALRGGAVPKGDALGVARVAGALGAKRAASLLPLCHPLALDAARVRVDVPAGAGAVRVRCAVRVTARTGAEMEALTGAAVAALALYDMCKALDRDMRITGLRLLTKSGGRSGDWPPPSPPPSPPAPPPAHPAPPSSPPAPPASEAGGETYAPTNFMHF